VALAMLYVSEHPTQFLSYNSTLFYVSTKVCQIMRMHDVPFTGHNVLADEELRQGIKEFSNWPTIPQVYLEGEFIGGCDIMLQMHQVGTGNI